jgi:hypothetical protein
MARITRMTLCLFVLATPASVIGQETATSGSVTDGAMQQGHQDPASEARVIPEGTTLRLNLPDAVRISRLKPGMEVQATLARPLFAGNQLAIPSGARMQFVVDSITKAKTKESNKDKLLNALDRAFNPLDHGHPTEYVLEVGDAVLFAGETEPLPLRVSFLRLGKSAQIRGGSPRHPTEPLPGSADGPRTGTVPDVDSNTPARSRAASKRSSQVLLLRLERELIVSPGSASTPERQTEHISRETEPGRTGRAYLLTSLSAAKNHQGDIFQARLSEPLSFGIFFYPAGTLVEGHVTRQVPPRWLSRPGLLALKVDRIIPADGDPLGVSGSLEGADADASSRFVMDEEGTMRGRKPGIGKALVDIGMGYAFGKIADDLSEAPIRAIAAGMGDASVATAARYVGFGTASVFLITRHGRDVKLAKYSEIEIYFARDPESAGKPASAGFGEYQPDGRARPASRSQNSSASRQN